MKNNSSTAKFSALITAFIAVAVVVFDFINPSPKVTVSDKYKNCDVVVHFVDVGQGDAIFAQLPNGENMLIDAGQDGNEIIEYINSLGEEKLDYVIATHPHSDHIGGMADVIHSFEIQRFFMPESSNNTSTFENMLDALIYKQVKSEYVKAGDVLLDKDSLKIEVLSPDGREFDDLNNYSAVIKLTYKDKAFLFMGDAEKKAEKLIKSDVQADVLKVGHHGSDTSTSKSFVDRVNPEVAVVSVGADNDYNHPDKKVIKRLENSNITVLRTDVSGTILIGTDGDNIIY